MIVVGNLDRTKHDIDVMERVFGGVSTSGWSEEIRGHPTNQEARWRLWLGVNSGTVRVIADDGESDR